MDNLKDLDKIYGGSEVRVGVIGYGAMGKNHLVKYLEMNNVVVVGVSDPDRSMFGKDFGIPIYSDYKELLDQNLDAVSIAVPTTLHKEVSIECCKKGVHCLIEKPIAVTTLEGKEIVEIAKQHNVKLLIGHIENFNPGVQYVKRMLDEKVIGDIITVHSSRMSPAKIDPPDVDVITDLGVHDFGVVRYLFGESLTDIISRSRVIRDEKKDIAVILGMIKKVLVLVEVNWISPFKVRELKINGYVGSITLDYMTQQIKLCYNGAITNEDYSIPVKVDYQEPLKLELEHFIDCIENDSQPLVDGNEGIKILEMAEEALK